MGNWSLKDATDTQVASAAFQSENIYAGFGVFFFSGSLDNPGGILTPTGGDWIYEGTPSATPDDILGTGDFGLDGVDGRATLGNPAAYTDGSLFDFQINGYMGDLDQFFSEDQSATNSDMDVYVVPAPAAAMLGLIGLGSFGMIGRRFR